MSVTAGGGTRKPEVQTKMIAVSVIIGKYLITCSRNQQRR